MKGFLLKDYYSVRNMRFLLIIFPVMMIFSIALGFSETANSSLPINGFKSMTVVSFMINVGTLLLAMGTDEACGWLGQGISLPLSRKDYMKEKYIFSLLTTAVTTGAALICAIIGMIVIGRCTADNIISFLLKAAFSNVVFIGLTVWIIAVGIRFGMKKLSVLFYAYMFIIGVYFGLWLALDHFEAVVVRYVIFAALGVATVGVFALGWRWIEKKDV